MSTTSPGPTPLRRCFLPPIPALDIAADLLDTAAEALLADRPAEAKAALVAADLGPICDFVVRITGPVDSEIHRYRPVPGTPVRRRDRARHRMPGRAVERRVFERDGWRCRFCGIRIVAKEAVRAFDRRFPDVVRWSDRRKHCALLALCSSLDHMVPHSRGGTNDPDNLVAACNACQFGRNQWTLEEVGIADPRLRPPVVDGWDGLLRLR